MFGSIEYLAMSSSHSSREGILSVKDKGPIAILDLPQILAPYVKLEFSSAAGCQGTQFDRGGNFFVAPLPYQVYQAFSR
jgi:hypothetical protein